QVASSSGSRPARRRSRRHRLVDSGPDRRGGRAARPPVRARGALAPGGGRREPGRDGLRRSVASGGWDTVIEVVEPATEQVMAEVPRAGAREVDAAVARAKRAFPAWRAIAPADRAVLLHRLANALEARLEELA